MSIRTKVGKRIKELRLKAGLSQEALAFMADLDRTYISSVESGKRNIAIVNLEKVSRALNVSLKHFFNSHSFSFKPASKSKGHK